jgi:5-methylcytosine-specific restriction protein A
MRPTAHRVCAEADCPAIVENGHRCAEHKRPWSSRPWTRKVAAVLQRDHGVCWICGKPGADSADHVVRWVDGGDDTLDNLRAAHIECNRRRG